MDCLSATHTGEYAHVDAYAAVKFDQAIVNTYCKQGTEETRYATVEIPTDGWWPEMSMVPYGLEESSARKIDTRLTYYNAIKTQYEDIVGGRAQEFLMKAHARIYGRGLYQGAPDPWGARYVVLVRMGHEYKAVAEWSFSSNKTPGDLRMQGEMRPGCEGHAKKSVIVAALMVYELLRKDTPLIALAGGGPVKDQIMTVTIEMPQEVHFAPASRSFPSRAHQVPSFAQPIMDIALPSLRGMESPAIVRCEFAQSVEEAPEDDPAPFRIENVVKDLLHFRPIGGALGVYGLTKSEFLALPLEEFVEQLHTHTFRMQKV